MTRALTNTDLELTSTSVALYYTNSGSIWTGPGETGTYVEVVSFETQASLVQIAFLPRPSTTIPTLNADETSVAITPADAEAARWSTAGVIVTISFPTPPARGETWQWLFDDPAKPTPLKLKVKVRRPA